MTETLTHTPEAPLAARREHSAPGQKRYAVKAIWRTLQGEGAWAGRPAVFIRFAGCNLWTGHAEDRDRDAARSGASCPLFCDTDFRKEGAARLSTLDLLEEVLRAAAGVNPLDPINFVVLTGGEPLLQADAALVETLHAAGFEVACETNGTVRLADAFRQEGGEGTTPPDWIVCSPKLPPERLVLEVMDELKLVVPAYDPVAYRPLLPRVRRHSVGGRMRRYLWLQPEDGPRLAEATRQTIALALEHPDWRVSAQTHKIIGVD
jgi:7-carboxy-7-deazaguanine synthase